MLQYNWKMLLSSDRKDSVDLHKIVNFGFEVPSS